MQAIIVAAGSGDRWNDYLGCRKHLITIDGETLLSRTVRLLKQRGIHNIYITHHPKHPYHVPNTMSVCPVVETSNAKARLATVPWWSRSQRTLILLGDVYFTDRAMNIMTREYTGWKHFARLSPSTATGKPGPEMFGCQFGPEDHQLYIKALQKAGPGSDWPAYCSITNHPVNTLPHDIKDWGMHVDIPDDTTDDFDYPDDYERWMYYVKNRSSRRVTYQDFEAEWLQNVRLELGYEFNVRRRLWEHCSIAQGVMDRVNFTDYQRSALGFGVGREHLPSWLTSKGIAVLATDGHTQDIWLDRQYSGSLDKVTRLPNVNELLLSYKSVDMRSVPCDLYGKFDVTWSSSAMEHLGSINAGIQFFLDQMKCLKPGGFAFHTTEYDYSTNGTPLETENLVLFQQRHLAELESRLRAQGDRLWPINLTRGSHANDGYVDREPYTYDPHINLAIGDREFTSVLLIASRGVS